MDPPPLQEESSLEEASSSSSESERSEPGCVVEPVQAQTTLRHRVVCSHEQAEVEVGDDCVYSEESEALLEEEQSYKEGSACMVMDARESVCTVKAKPGSSLLEDWQNNSQEVTALREELRHSERAHQLRESQLSALKQLSEKLARDLEVKDENIITLQANISILEEKLAEHEVKLRSEKAEAEREKYMDEHNIECLKMVIAGHELQVRQLLEEKERASQTFAELEQRIQDLEADLNETSFLLAKERRLSLSIFEMCEKKRVQSITVMLYIVLGMFLITLLLIGILYIRTFNANY